MGTILLWALAAFLTIISFLVVIFIYINHIESIVPKDFRKGRASRHIRNQTHRELFRIFIDDAEVVEQEYAKITLGHDGLLTARYIRHKSKLANGDTATVTWVNYKHEIRFCTDTFDKTIKIDKDFFGKCFSAMLADIKAEREAAERMEEIGESLKLSQEVMDFKEKKKLI